MRKQDIPRIADFTKWVVDHPPPSLDALVEKWGGWNKVPGEAWERFRLDREEWERERQDRMWG